MQKSGSSSQVLDKALRVRVHSWEWGGMANGTRQLCWQKRRGCVRIASLATAGNSYRSSRGCQAKDPCAMKAIGRVG